MQARMMPEFAELLKPVYPALCTSARVLTQVNPPKRIIDLSYYNHDQIFQFYEF